MLNDWTQMLEQAAHPWWKDRKRDRMQKRFEKIVEGVRDRHDKLSKKGCTFEKINQQPSAGEHFINHSHMCNAMNAYFKGENF